MKMERTELVRAAAAEALRRRWYGIPTHHYDEWGLRWAPEPTPAPCCAGVRGLRRHVLSAKHVSTLAGVDHREVIRAMKLLAAEAYRRRQEWAEAGQDEVWTSSWDPLTDYEYE